MAFPLGARLMPASGTCRRCGAGLAPEVPWCGQCLSPVAGPAPPPPMVFAANERATHEKRYSRWHAGPTTFGPVGRVLTTILVLSFGPWAGGISFFTLMWTPCWVVIATVLLRQIWRREPVMADPGPEHRPGRSPDVNLRVIAVASILLVVVGVGLVLVTGNTASRFVVIALLAMVGLGLAIERLAGL